MSVEPARRAVPQFFSFGVAGVIGFLVDTVVLYFCIGPLSLNIYCARVVSYTFATTTTWYLNRKSTFRSPSSRVYREWLLFAATNVVGGALNYGVFAGLVSQSSFVADNPVIGVAAGSLAGMFINFALSKKNRFQPIRIVNEIRGK